MEAKKKGDDPGWPNVPNVLNEAQQIKPGERRKKDTMNYKSILGGLI